MAVAKPVVKAPVKAVAKPVAKAPAPAPKPVAKPVAKAAPAPAPKPVAKPAPAPKPVAKPAVPNQAAQLATFQAQQRAAAQAAQQKIQAQQQAATQAQAAKLQQQRAAQQQALVQKVQSQLAPKPAPAPVQQPGPSANTPQTMPLEMDFHQQQPGPGPAPNPFQGYTQPAPAPVQQPSPGPGNLPPAMGIGELVSPGPGSEPGVGIDDLVWHPDIQPGPGNQSDQFNPEYGGGMTPILSLPEDNARGGYLGQQPSSGPGQPFIGYQHDAMGDPILSQPMYGQPETPPSYIDPNTGLPKGEGSWGVNPAGGNLVWNQPPAPTPTYQSVLNTIPGQGAGFQSGPVNGLNPNQLNQFAPGQGTAAQGLNALLSPVAPSILSGPGR